MAVEATTAQTESRFPPLADSPYAVATTSRRERWWFSNGVWIDQGPTGAVVGFVCAHWLADRGVRMTGVTFDEDFARDLYRAAQRVGDTSSTGDEDTGAFLWAAVEVLQSRGLVEAAYSCGDIDAVVAALLERGPVLAGCYWRNSLFTPRNIGGRMVCRLERGDDNVVGGHAVLLNGIALDDEVDGVAGLVRFKNSWGRAWGDDGQAYIPVADLAQILADDVILPIPPAELLESGVRQEEAIDETAPIVVRYEQEAIGSDLWTAHDTVGYGPYADAIARGIQHVETRPPLTIGIKAPWGAGKTSLMRMIQQRLEWPLRDAPEDRSLRPIRLVTPIPHSDVTNGAVLRSLKEAPPSTDIKAVPKHDPGPDEVAAAEDESRWRPTVWFNPWMYQTGEQIWAGLAHAIIDQTTSRMSRVEREHFWLALNLRRVDEHAVRRRIYTLVFERVVPAAIGLLATLVLGLVLLTVHRLRWVGTVTAGASPLALLGFVAVHARAVLGAKVGGSLAQLVGPQGGVAAFARTELQGGLDTFVQAPDYAAQTGFLYLVQTDLARVLALVATPERPLVVFVDDLDRCSPSTVVQAIEAINLFLAGELENTIFVIAMEPEMVVAHIEAAYDDLVEKVREQSGQAGVDGELGWRFLEKFVQLPLTLPGIAPTGLTTFFESLFPGAPPPQPEPEAPAPQEPASAASSPAGDVVGTVVPPPPAASAASREALRRFVDTRLLRDSDEIKALIFYATEYLKPPNPREIKRFVNLFRFFVMIHTERIIATLPTARSLDQLAKLALVSTRWPSLMVALAAEAVPDSGQTVFELLEQPPQTQPKRGEAAAAAQLRGLTESLGGCGLSEGTIARIVAADVRELLASEPIVGEPARVYL